MAADLDPRDGGDAGGRFSARRRAAGPGRRRVDPALAGSARHRLVHRERRLPRRPTRWTATPAPAGPAPSPTRSGCRSIWVPPPRSPRSSCSGKRRTPRRSRSRRPGRHELDHDLLHDHRHRRHADPHRDRHRPVRPHVRHGPRHPVRLLAVGIPGLRQPEQRRHLRHHGRRPGPARHRVLDRERRHARGGRGQRQHSAPAGPARSAIRSGCRWTSGPARRSAGSR